VKKGWKNWAFNFPREIIITCRTMHGQRYFKDKYLPIGPIGLQFLKCNSKTFWPHCGEGVIKLSFQFS
jgi:hypothetical protein